MKFTLGTAQLGLPKYGRTNATGCPPEADAVALIRAAVDGGVKFIDSARAYGLSEGRVGQAVFGDRFSIDGATMAVARIVRLGAKIRPSRGKPAPYDNHQALTPGLVT
jgi:aryl-alcohol dehydrogenase-like predicted oxidoreductase